MDKIESIQLHTARILRDNPDLRTLDKRDKVVQLVRIQRPDAKPWTIDRCARHIQNKLGLYKPAEDDGRYDKEKEYRQYFKGGGYNGK